MMLGEDIYVKKYKFSNANIWTKNTLELGK